MATKLDYLKDLREHPASTGGEGAARLDVGEPAILEFYRRGRRQTLIAGDGGRPEKFTLTDAGLAQLRVLEAEASPSPTPSLPTKLEEKFSELEETVHDTVEDVKGLFGLVDRILQAKGTSPAVNDLADELHGEIADLEEQKQKLEEKLTKTSILVEFFGFRLASQLSFYDLPSRFRERARKLGEKLDAETQESVLRLVELEKELGEGRPRLFGPNHDKVLALQAEIGGLREKLGFAALDWATGREEESGEAE